MLLYSKLLDVYVKINDLSFTLLLTILLLFTLKNSALSQSNWNKPDWLMDSNKLLKPSIFYPDKIDNSFQYSINALLFAVHWGFSTFLSCHCNLLAKESSSAYILA